MKAIRIHEFGGSEVMKLEDIKCPVPAADEILVKAFANGVNPVDWAVRFYLLSFSISLKSLSECIPFSASVVICCASVAYSNIFFS